MNNGKTPLTWVMLVIAAGLLMLSVRQPLWRMHMEAPQYQGEEALEVAIYPNAMRGDLEELHTLNQYIGVHLPETLPQFSWLPVVLLAAAFLPLAGALAKGRTRTAVLLATPILLVGVLCLAALQGRHQMREIGHNRDEKTIMAGVKDFTPPFLGNAKIAQFQITSRFDKGTALVALAVTLQLGAAALTRVRRSPGGREKAPDLVSPQPKGALA